MHAQLLAAALVTGVVIAIIQPSGVSLRHFVLSLIREYCTIMALIYIPAELRNNYRDS